MNAQSTLPRIRVGKGPSDGTGGVCAMQMISWQNGDKQITDFPECADPMLARIVQAVNDRYCSHRGANRAWNDLLCSPCSVRVLALANRTVGTNLEALGWSARAIHGLYVDLTVELSAEIKRPEDLARWLLLAGGYVSESAARTLLSGYTSSAQMLQAHRVIDRFRELAGLDSELSPLPIPREVALAEIRGRVEDSDAH